MDASKMDALAVAVKLMKRQHSRHEARFLSVSVGIYLGMCEKLSHPFNRARAL